MLKLWRYTTAHRLLLPIQQLLQRHRSSMAVLRPIITALQDVSSGQQLHVKLQQQLHPEQQQTQQQHSWSQLLAEPSEALVQQLHNQLPGVARKVLLQLLRLLAAAVSGLDVSVTPDVLQQMLHALDHPGTFQPAVQPQGNSQQQPQQQVQQQAEQSNTNVKTEQADQQQQLQQTAHAVQYIAEAVLPAVSLFSSAADMQLQAADTNEGNVQQQQQQQQEEEEEAAAAVHVAAVPDMAMAALRPLSSQQVEEEPYSPTRHAAEEVATAGAAAADASMLWQAGAASNQQQQGGQQQQQLLGAKRAAERSGEQLQQSPRKKPAIPQSMAAASSRPDASGTAANPTAAPGDAFPGTAAAAAGAQPADAAAAAAGGSKYKLPGEAYALTLFDDLRFSLQQLRAAKAVVDTRAGRLVQLSWYLQVNEPLRQRLPDQELALKFLAKFPGEGRQGVKFWVKCMRWQGRCCVLGICASTGAAVVSDRDLCWYVESATWRLQVEQRSLYMPF
jgi:hypothetical protein